MPKKQKDDSSVEESNEEEIESVSAESSEEQEKTTTKKRKKSTVKKAATAYSFYMKERQQDIRSEDPKLTFGEISKKISTEWKAMSEEKKKPYADKALEDKERYQKEKSEANDEEETPAKKKKGKDKDPNAPKRNINAYMFYSQEIRPKVVEELGPESGKKITDVTKIVSARWKQLSPEEKKPFEDMAKRDKERYDKDMEEYKNKSK